MINRIISLILIFSHLLTYTYGSWFDAIRTKEYAVYQTPFFDYSRLRLDFTNMDQGASVNVRYIRDDQSISTNLFRQEIKDRTDQERFIQISDILSLTFYQKEGCIFIKNLFSKTALDIIADQTLTFVNISTDVHVRFSSTYDVIFQGNCRFDNTLDVKGKQLYLFDNFSAKRTNFLTDYMRGIRLVCRVSDELNIQGISGEPSLLSFASSNLFIHRLNTQNNHTIDLSSSHLYLLGGQKLVANHLSLTKSTFNFLEELAYDIPTASLSESSIQSGASLILTSSKIAFKSTDSITKSKISAWKIKKTGGFNHKTSLTALAELNNTRNQEEGLGFVNLDISADFIVQNQKNIFFHGCTTKSAKFFLDTISWIDFNNSFFDLDYFVGSNIQTLKLIQTDIIAQYGVGLKADFLELCPRSGIFNGSGNFNFNVKTLRHYGLIHATNSDVLFGAKDARLSLESAGGKIKIQDKRKNATKIQFYLDKGFLLDESAIEILGQEALFDIKDEILFLNKKSTITSNFPLQFVYDAGIELHDGSKIKGKKTTLFYEKKSFIPPEFKPEQTDTAQDVKAPPNVQQESTDRTDHEYTATPATISGSRRDQPEQQTEDTAPQQQPRSRSAQRTSYAENLGRVDVKNNSQIDCETDLFINTMGIITVDQKSSLLAGGDMTLFANKGFQISDSTLHGKVFDGTFLCGTTLFFDGSTFTFDHFKADARDIEAQGNHQFSVNFIDIGAKKIHGLNLNHGHRTISIHSAGILYLIKTNLVADVCKLQSNKLQLLQTSVQAQKHVDVYAKETFLLTRSTISSHDKIFFTLTQSPHFEILSKIRSNVVDATYLNMGDSQKMKHLSDLLIDKKNLKSDTFILRYDGVVVNQNPCSLATTCFLFAHALVNYSKIESDHALVLVLKSHFFNNRLGAADEIDRQGFKMESFPLSQDQECQKQCKQAVEGLKAYFIKKDEESLLNSVANFISSNESNLFSLIKTKGPLRIQAPIISSITGSLEGKKLLLQSPDIQFGVGIEGKEDLTLKIGIPSEDKTQTQVVSKYECGPVYIKGEEGILVENNGGRFISTLGRLLTKKNVNIQDSKLFLNYGGQAHIAGDFFLNADMFINQTGVRSYAGILGYDEYDLQLTTIPIFSVEGKTLASVRMFKNIGGMINLKQGIDFDLTKLEDFENRNLLLHYQRHYYHILEFIKHESHFMYDETFYSYIPEEVNESGSYRFVPSTMVVPKGLDVQTKRVVQKGNIITSKIHLRSTQAPLELGHHDDVRMVQGNVFFGFIPSSIKEKHEYQTVPVSQLGVPVVILADKNMEEALESAEFILPHSSLFEEGLIQKLNTPDLWELQNPKKIMEQTYTFFKKNADRLAEGSVVPETIQGNPLPIMVTNTDVLAEFDGFAIVYQLYEHEGKTVYAPTLYAGKNNHLAMKMARGEGTFYQRNAEEDQDDAFNILLESCYGIIQGAHLDAQSDIAYSAPYVKVKRRTHESVAVWDEAIFREEHSGGMFQDTTTTQGQALKTFTEREDAVMFKTDGKVLFFTKELEFKGVDVLAAKGRYGVVLNASINDIDYQIPIQGKKSSLFSYNNYTMPVVQSVNFGGQEGDTKILALDSIFLNGIKIKAGEKIKFISVNDLIASAFFETSKHVSLRSLRKDVVLSTKGFLQTAHDHENYQYQCAMRAGAVAQDIHIAAPNGSVHTKGVDLTAEKIIVEAGVDYIDQPEGVAHSRKSTAEHEVSVRSRVSTMKAKDITVAAGRAVGFIGTDIEADKLKVITVQGPIIFKDANDQYQYSLDTSSSKAYNKVSISVPSTIKAKETLLKTFGGDNVTFVGTKIKCPQMKIDLNGGEVHFKLGENKFYSYRFDDDSNPFWQDIDVEEKEDTTYVYPEIIGNINITGAQKIIAEKVEEASKKHNSQGYYTSVMYAMMDELSVSADKSNDNDYWKAFQNIDEQHLEFALAKEIHDYSYKNITGVGPAFAVMIAVVIAVCTSGVGAGIAGQLTGMTATFASGTIGAAMANAAFISICTQLTVNTINNGGNPFKSIGQLFSSHGLKSLGISILAAGVANFALDQLGLGSIGAENAFQEAAEQAAKEAATKGVEQAAINNMVANGVSPEVLEAAKTPIFNINNITKAFKTSIVQNISHATVSTAFGEKGAYRNFLQDSLVSLGRSLGAEGINCAEFDNATRQMMNALKDGCLGAVVNGAEGAACGAAGSLIGSYLNQTLIDENVDGKAAEKIAQAAAALAGVLTKDAQNVHIAHQAGAEAIQSDTFAENRKKAREQIQQAKAMQDAQAKEIQKERARQTAAKEEKAKAREQQSKKDPLSQEQAEAVSDYLRSAKHPMGDSNTEDQLDLLKNHNARGRAAYRLETAARSRSDSPITKLYKELTIKIGINEEQRKEVLKKGEAKEAYLLGREFQELLDEKMTLESQMYKRQAYRECADGDVRGYLRAGEIITSFMPNLAGAVVNAGFSAVGSYVDYTRGTIDEGEYYLDLIGASIGLGSAILGAKRGQLHQISHSEKQMTRSMLSSKQEHFKNFVYKAHASDQKIAANANRFGQHIYMQRTGTGGYTTSHQGHAASTVTHGNTASKTSTTSGRNTQAPAAKASVAPKAQQAPATNVEQTHISTNNGGFRQFDHKATEIAEAVKNGKTHDYSKAYPGEVKNFISANEFEGTLSKPLRVVSYHSDKPVGSGRTIKYWTPVREGNEMGTIEQVMDRLSLLSEWGNRTHVSIAEIPAGEYVKFMHGRALCKESEHIVEIRPGEGVQYCFEKFNESWIKMTREIPGVK